MEYTEDLDGGIKSIGARLWIRALYVSVMKLDPWMANVTKNIADYFGKWNHEAELNTEWRANMSLYKQGDEKSLRVTDNPLIYSLFWDVTQRPVIVTHVSGESIGSIFDIYTDIYQTVVIDPSYINSDNSRNVIQS